MDHYTFLYIKENLHTLQLLGSIVVSIPACHAGDRGSIPRRGGVVFFSSCSMPSFADHDIRFTKYTHK